MTKIQCIISLFLLITLIFSMDMIFGNPIYETFSGRIGIAGASNIGVNDIGFGRELDYIPRVGRNGNIGLNSVGIKYLGIAQNQLNMNQYVGDDQPLFFGFS